MEKAAGFGWLRLFCIQLAPTQLIRRMGAGLVIVYGLGLILPLPPTVGYLYPLVSSMSSHTSKRME